jgi:pyruvate dehydrogenase E2 component (dihydrolipoamide acetyltransferase)
MSRPNRLLASPRARRAMIARGISGHSVKGTGPRHRIVEADVLRFGSTPATSISRQPLSGIRRTIARRLVEAKQTVPHFYVRKTVNVDALLTFQQSRRLIHPCSLNDLMVMAVAKAVSEFPVMRSRIEGNDLVTMPNTNIGVAVGMDDGVVVPVILDADRLPLASLALETRWLIEFARKKRVENVGRGVFSVSNLGMFGVEEFTAIINPPESGILAVGAVRETLVLKNGVVHPVKVLTLTLSCDHRIVDGVAAARFLNRLTELIENPQFAP